MSARRVIWHVGFERNLHRRGPRSFEIRSEVPLSDEPPRLDYLLLRKLASPGEELDDSAETLRRLWPMLPHVSVLEYKSPSRPYRSGNLDRLWSYLHGYYAGQRALPRRRADGAPIEPGTDGAPEVLTRGELCGVLAVPRRSPGLDADVAGMGLSWEDLSDGYWRLHGGLFTLHVLEIDVVGPAEGDDLLYSLGHGTLTTAAVRWFWTELVGSKEMTMSMQDMEGYDELMQKLLATLSPEQRLAGLAPEQVLAHLPPEQRLAGLDPEQRLAGLDPEQRLAGLDPEQVLAHYPPEQRLAHLDRDHQALALPIEVLRLLPEQYLRSLAPEVQEELRRRLAQNGH